MDIPINADATEFNKVIDASEKRLDDLAKRSSEVTGASEKSAKTSFNKILMLARLGWSATDAMFQAMGTTMNAQFKSLIQSGFSAISVLTSIFTAQESNPFTAAFGAFSLAQIGMSVASLIQFQLGQQEAAKQTTEGANMLYSVGNFLGGISYL